MHLIDECHRAGIGVILDWVPGHFCRDAHGLGRFDGTALYESGDMPGWGTYKFNYARNEVRLVPHKLRRFSGWKSTTPTRCAWTA